MLYHIVVGPFPHRADGSTSQFTENMAGLFQLSGVSLYAINPYTFVYTETLNIMAATDMV